MIWDLKMDLQIEPDPGSRSLPDRVQNVVYSFRCWCQSFQKQLVTVRVLNPNALKYPTLQWRVKLKSDP